MSSYPMENPKYAVCPYNPAHVMKPLRLVHHLLKCRVTAPNAHKFVVCPFNATHHILATEKLAHLMICRDRRYIDTDPYVKRKAPYCNLTLPPCDVDSPGIVTGEWDTELEAETDYSSSYDEDFNSEADESAQVEDNDDDYRAIRYLNDFTPKPFAFDNYQYPMPSYGEAAKLKQKVPVSESETSSTFATSQDSRSQSSESTEMSSKMTCEPQRGNDRFDGLSADVMPLPSKMHSEAEESRCPRSPPKVESTDRSEFYRSTLLNDIPVKQPLPRFSAFDQASSKMTSLREASSTSFNDASSYTSVGASSRASSSTPYSEVENLMQKVAVSDKQTADNEMPSSTFVKSQGSRHQPLEPVGIRPKTTSDYEPPRRNYLFDGRSADAMPSSSKMRSETEESRCSASLPKVEPIDRSKFYFSGRLNDIPVKRPVPRFSAFGQASSRTTSLREASSTSFNDASSCTSFGASSRASCSTAYSEVGNLMQKVAVSDKQTADNEMSSSTFGTSQDSRHQSSESTGIWPETTSVYEEKDGGGGRRRPSGRRSTLDRITSGEPQRRNDRFDGLSSDVVSMLNKMYSEPEESRCSGSPPGVESVDRSELYFSRLLNDIPVKRPVQQYSAVGHTSSRGKSRHSENGESRCSGSLPKVESIDRSEFYFSGLLNDIPVKRPGPRFSAFGQASSRTTSLREPSSTSFNDASSCTSVGASSQASSGKGFGRGRVWSKDESISTKRN